MIEPLTDALRLQLAAAAEGFDWSEADEALWAKLAEEIEELRSAETPEDRQEELGDLLFMVVNVARHLGVDSVGALIAANAKFSRRYAHVMASPAELPPLGEPERIQQMETRWRQAKQLEREGKLR